MSETVPQLLRRARTERGLTTSDLALWLGRPFHTVRSWIEDGHEPKPGVREEVMRRMELLYTAPEFPIPYEVLARQRKAYIREVFGNAERRHKGVS